MPASSSNAGGATHYALDGLTSHSIRVDLERLQAERVLPKDRTAARRRCCDRPRPCSRAQPLLSTFYDLSCFAYTATGSFYLASLSRLPLPCRVTPFTSGRTFGGLMCIQGPASYGNDVFQFRDTENWPLLVYSDRAMAITNFIIMLGCARSWPSDRPALRLVRNGVVGACCLTFPMSMACLLTGRLEQYLHWHSAWHYVPNALALLYFGLQIRRPGRLATGLRI